jgi:hypothetical protein
MIVDELDWIALDEEEDWRACARHLFRFSFGMDELRPAFWDGSFFCFSFLPLACQGWSSGLIGLRLGWVVARSQFSSFPLLEKETHHHSILCAYTKQKKLHL